MNLDKAKKRILKKVKMGFQGYPQISITYYGASKALATKVIVGFVMEENAQMMEETFTTTDDIREDDAVQSAIIKIIDRSGAKTVLLEEDVVVVAEGG